MKLRDYELDEIVGLPVQGAYISKHATELKRFFEIEKSFRLALDIVIRSDILDVGHDVIHEVAGEPPTIWPTRRAGGRSYLNERYLRGLRRS